MTLVPQNNKIDFPTFSVNRWFAWAPGLDSQDKWLNWYINGSQPLTQDGTDPSMEFLPVEMRKRLSSLTKISLWLAFNILSKQELSSTYTVFASRHGESRFTIELLQQIFKKETLSPMAFSRSVHNTSSGIFGIAAGNSAASTSISACENTFSMGMLQASIALTRYEQVLYVMADDKLHSDFVQYVNEPWGKYGTAFLLRSGKEQFLLKEDPLLPPSVLFLQTQLSKHLYGGNS